MATIDQYKSDLKIKLDAFDKKAAAILVESFTRLLYQTSQAIDLSIAENMLKQLRNSRMFDCMQKLADALIFTKRESEGIYKLYAQSLIDSSQYAAALCILDGLIERLEKKDPASDVVIQEMPEAVGLKGRLYKQLYINAKQINAFSSDFLVDGFEYYKKVYDSDKQKHLWPGINMVALMWRAEQDGVLLNTNEQYTVIAKAILEVIETKEKNLPNKDTWDYATAAEACVALNKPGEAEKWIAFYVNDENINAFTLSSTLRQFKEVWQLTTDTDMGKRVLHILQNALLKREGGNVIVEADDIRNMTISDKNIYEKNHGPNVFIDFTSYKKGYSCCEAVARIGLNNVSGEGTGFLLKGKDLKESWGDEWVLITNSHVISNDDNVRAVVKALHPSQARIIFEALNRNEIFKAGEILFTSPPKELDVTIIRFRPEEMDRLNALTKNVEAFSLSEILPLTGGDPYTDPRLYVIGHPDGGPLQFSMQDNLMLDTDKKRLIHYRTPTEGGSSGSPVFNDQWELVGLHHAGDAKMPRLNGKEGTYEANEGIWIQAIKNAIGT